MPEKLLLLVESGQVKRCKQKITIISVLSLSVRHLLSFLFFAPKGHTGHLNTTFVDKSCFC